MVNIMNFRPVDIARKLGVSTTTLRKYEEFGLAPPASRTETGYRLYTSEHLAYFTCAREMLTAFSTSEISNIFQPIIAHRDINSAFWKVNHFQAKLHEQKMIAEKIVKTLLRDKDKPIIPHQEQYTINEISKKTGVPATTIRYWDKVGLISATRSLENNYRIFHTEHIRQILAIYALKFTVYVDYGRHSIERIRKDLESFDYSDQDRIVKMMGDIHQYLKRVNRGQLKGIAALYQLCCKVEQNEF